MTKTKEHRQKLNKEYRERHKERLKLKHKAHRRQHPEIMWNAHMKRRYGIDFGQYLALLEFQEGLCAICGKPPGDEKLAIDHDHATKRVRGLVHRKCNAGIGFFEDDPEKLRDALQYLEFPPFDRFSST